MGQILVRQIDDEVLALLKVRAKANQRSTEAEVRTIITETVKPSRRPGRPVTELFGAGIQPGGKRRTMEEIVEHVRRVRDGGDL